MTLLPEGSVKEQQSGLTIERLFEGQLVIFTLSDMKRETVDAWIDACLGEMRICLETGRLLRVIQDLSHPAANHTPYSQKRGSEVTEAYPELKGYVAFILESSVEATRTQMFIRSQPHRYRVRDVFFDRDEAIIWIVQQSGLAST
ncbi:MAG: hypothetical protein IT322_18225 [Anaerolineae bacterium]|nr:hypothetical protein [Anaerolineae bacterium]